MFLFQNWCNLIIFSSYTILPNNNKTWSWDNRVRKKKKKNKIPSYKLDLFGHTIIERPVMSLNYKMYKQKKRKFAIHVYIYHRVSFCGKIISPNQGELILTMCHRICLNKRHGDLNGEDGCVLMLIQHHPFIKIDIKIIPSQCRKKCRKMGWRFFFVLFFFYNIYHLYSIIQ